jgi:glutaminyl-tRNA synthetase
VSDNFLRDIVAADLRSGKRTRVVTRFPPEPNGYLHIGHAKSICLNFGLAQEFGGACHLRMDDTNPLKEGAHYVAGIQRDVRWLGFEWGDREFAASQYFGQLYAWAEKLVEAGRAYVDDLSDDEIRQYRGSVSEPGRPSPWRDRPAAENLDLLRRMRAGEFPDGARVLRAKGDLSAANMKMRDPLIYRIRHVVHHATSEPWAIWPMYDYAHCLSDYIEGITHSLCTLEFEVNRELYDWFLELLELPEPRPRQYEFARLNLAYTMMSKRRLLELVNRGTVTGWDDPRMPTLAGMRRRGVTPESIRLFVERVGVARAENLVEPGLLDAAIRDDLDARCPRRMAVLRPIKVVLDNWPVAETVSVVARDWPESSGREGARELPFGRELWIDRDDFATDPPAGWHRLAPGAEVRLRYAYVIRCTSVERDATGEPSVIHCTVDRATAGGVAPEGRKVKGIIHWVPGDAPEAVVRLFDRLFDSERPDQDEDWLATLNPHSRIDRRARIEPSLLGAAPGARFQLERACFAYVDEVDSRPGAPVFHRIVGLRDGFAKTAHEPAAAPRPVQAARTPVAPREVGPGVAAWVRRGAGEPEAEVLDAEPAIAALVDAMHTAGAPVAHAASFAVHEVRRALRDHGGTPDPARLTALIGLVDAGKITMATARQVLGPVLREGADPAAWVATHGLGVIADDGALAAAVDAVLAELPDKVAAYRGGKTGLLGLFVGQVMKRTGGRADAARVSEILARALSRLSRCARKR